MEITLDQAEQLVQSRNDMFWDGWEFIHTSEYPANAAILRKDTIYRNGKWHIAKRYPLSDEGTYIVTKALGRGL